MKINVAGVLIDSVTKAEAIDRIDGFIKSGRSHYVVTPYSELIVFADQDKNYQDVLNHADLSLPDGIGILWAAKYLSLPPTTYNLLTTLASIIFFPSYIRTVIKEQISGSRFIFDIAKLASDKNYSISLVGGADNVAQLSANKLKQLYPVLNIKLALSSQDFNEQLVQQIAQYNSDILLIAYSPPKQETWIANNLNNLNSRVVIGLGGTFDYLAGKRPSAPRFLAQIGLEWLWRLITQPWRIKRIWNAVPVFIWKTYKYKRLKI